MLIAIYAVGYLLIGASYSIYFISLTKLELEEEDKGFVSFTTIMLWPYLLFHDTLHFVKTIYIRYKIRKLIKENEALIKEKMALLEELVKEQQTKV